MNEKIKLAVFDLCDKHYGIDIRIIHDVIDFSNLDIYKIPGTLEYIEGLLKYKGDVVPIINLIKKMNICVANDNSTIIIVEFDGSKIGLLVDKIVIQEASIENNNINLINNNDYIKNVAKVRKKSIYILDLNKFIINR